MSNSCIIIAAVCVGLQCCARHARYPQEYRLLAGAGRRNLPLVVEPRKNTYRRSPRWLPTGARLRLCPNRILEDSTPFLDRTLTGFSTVHTYYTSGSTIPVVCILNDEAVYSKTSERPSCKEKLHFCTPT